MHCIDTIGIEKRVSNVFGLKRSNKSNMSKVRIVSNP
jgi:hypothetical protein